MEHKKNWMIQKDLGLYELWISEWQCADGDIAELYVKKDGGGFELYCFSGVPASKIM
ncbi:MAG: hypothetical protein AB1695_12585 [Stygiobacter sp.]